VARVSDEQLAQWAAEVEIAPGAGAARTGGQWTVEIAAVDTQPAALAVYDALRAAGYVARIRPVAVEAGVSYRVRVPGLATQQDARALAAQLAGRFGPDAPRVVR
jgi:cell division septation protein DedD